MRFEHTLAGLFILLFFSAAAYITIDLRYSDHIDDPVTLRVASHSIVDAAVAELNPPHRTIANGGVSPLTPLQQALLSHEWQASIGNASLRCSLEAHARDRDDMPALQFTYARRNESQARRVSARSIEHLKLDEVSDHLRMTHPFNLVELRDGAWYIPKIERDPDTLSLSDEELATRAARAIGACALAGVSLAAKENPERVAQGFKDALSTASDTSFLYQPPDTGSGNPG